MARASSGTGRRNKRRTEARAATTRKTKFRKKRKVAVLRKKSQSPPARGSSDNTPSRVAQMPIRDTSNLDVANEIARRQREQLAAAAPVQQPPQQLSAVLGHAYRYLLRCIGLSIRIVGGFGPRYPPFLRTVHEQGGV
jgi:hypothetical protein